MARILVVDDDRRQCQLIAHTLASVGHGVVLARDAEQGIEAYRKQPADLVLTDLVMPGKSGLEFIAELHRQHPRVPVIVMTAGGMSAIAESFELTTELGAARTLNKPFSRAELLAVVAELLPVHRAPPSSPPPADSV